MNNVSQANFLLIDGVLRPGAIARLYQRGESLDIVPLYMGTRWAGLHDLGPILVSPQGPSSLLDETRANAARQADACLLSSSAPINAVAHHLRRFLAPADVLGGVGLLRFADPLVARYWLGSYRDAHLDAILGPIDAWHAPEIPHAWEPAQPLRWCSSVRTAPAPEWVDTHAQLGDLQLNALDQAARWRFMEQLHSGLEQRHPHALARINNSQLSQWFDERFDEARAWGLASDRSLAIWVEYSLRWGDGFTQRPDGPYQQWLARSPDALTLAPELRLQQMDEACVDIELNKEVS
ncbi:DUF4123 domain-containing protein [Pseudomonas sp. Pseusp122]|uniref:DUF4123 domain-containing protein n=1 Tax=unclassified Pseudomonas TaxID=196821 RepID=UPI0039A6BB45